MTVDAYEKEGGFREELGHVREIGMRIVSLKEALPVRPHRQPELDALNKLSAALDELRLEIGVTRNL
jgi:hypothetical protein